MFGRLKIKNAYNILTKQITILKWRTRTWTHMHVLECFGGKAVGTGRQTVSTMQPWKPAAQSTHQGEKVILLLSVDCPVDWKGIFPLPHPPLLAVSPTPTNHWTGWGRDFLLVCVIGSSQCVPSPVRAGSRPKAACLDMWVHCRLWASTNLTGRFLLTFPHGYMHIWVEFILPLLFVTATFAFNPQPLSCGAPGEADIVPVVAACLLFLTRTQKLGKKKKKMSLTKGKQACLQWYFSAQFRLVWKPE